MSETTSRTIAYFVDANYGGRLTRQHGLPQAIARNESPAAAPFSGGGGVDRLGDSELGPPQADGSYKLFVAQLPYDVAGEPTGSKRAFLDERDS